MIQRHRCIHLERYYYNMLKKHHIVSETFTALSIRIGPANILTNSIQALVSFTITPTFVSGHFEMDHTQRNWTASHSGFNFHFPVMSILLSACWHLYVFYREVSIQFFCHFWSGFTLSFYWVVWILCRSQIWSPHKTKDVQILYPFSTVYFLFKDNFFPYAETFNLIYSI